MDLSRRGFLTYVRNKVAVGVLCSELLTDALTTLEFVEQDPQAFTATQAAKQFEDWRLGYTLTEEIIKDDLYHMSQAVAMDIMRRASVHEDFR